MGDPTNAANPTNGPKSFWSGKAASSGPPPPTGPAPRLTVWQVYASPQGRIGRQSFWLALLPAVAVEIAVAALLSIPRVPGLVVPALVLAAVVNVMLLIKRWHDRARSGWMTLVYLIPLAGPIWTLVECGCLEGTAGPNRYGSATSRTPFG